MALLACVTREGRRLAVHHVAFPDADAHAGWTETSVMLHLASELVRLDRAAASLFVTGGAL